MRVALAFLLLTIGMLEVVPSSARRGSSEEDESWLPEIVIPPLNKTESKLVATEVLDIMKETAFESTWQSSLTEIEDLIYYSFGMEDVVDLDE